MPAMLLQQQSNNDLHQKQQQDQEQHLERSRSHTSFASPASGTSASLLRKSWPATSQNGLTNLHRHHTLPSQKLSEKDQSPKTGKRRRSSFYKIFPDVAGVEEVIKSYHCALVGDILLQGSLYVTANWFCFCSKLLVKKSIRIPVSSITNISKKNTAKIIPNAIGVSTDSTKYVFGSLMSRDNTYQLMISLWQHARGSGGNGEILEDGAIICGEETIVDQQLYVQSSTDDDRVFSSGRYTDVEEDGETSCSTVGLPLDVNFSNLDAVRSSSALGGRNSSGELMEQQLARVCATGSRGDDKSKTEFSKRLFCCASVKKMITQFQSLPCTCLYLSISTVLVLFLLFSAVLLTWKLVHLQTEIDTIFHPDGSRTSASYRHLRYCDDDSFLLHQNCFTKLEEIRQALEAQIVLVDQVSAELLALEESRRTICTVSEEEEKS